MSGAVRARATTGIRLSASSMPRNPAAAIGSHGTWLDLGRVVSGFGDGEVLDVPGSPRVVHAPGHTGGSAA